jgi:hypothetical protein
VRARTPAAEAPVAAWLLGGFSGRGLPSGMTGRMPGCKVPIPKFKPSGSWPGDEVAVPEVVKAEEEGGPSPRLVLLGLGMVVAHLFSFLPFLECGFFSWVGVVWR